MGNAVVVLSIDDLEDYEKQLQIIKEELDTTYSSLAKLTEKQKENWNDPQYDNLRANVEEYCTSANTQLEELEKSIVYINCLVAKLRGI